jgi:hypothetical protein
VIKRRLTVGTKVRINCPDANDGELHGKTGKIVKRHNNGKFPYIVEVDFDGRKASVLAFSRKELTRINKKALNYKEWYKYLVETIQ